VGDTIVIGFTTNTNATLESAREMRRIERISGTTTPITFTLDRPLGFYHPTGALSHVKEATTWVSDANNAPNDKIITWIPGVYEAVDTPDPVMAIEPRYFLGTQAKRDFFAAYKGQQTFTGALNGIVLLNGWPIRFPFGSVVTTATTIPGGTGSSLVQTGGSTSPGLLYIEVATGSPFTVGNIICIGTSVDVDTDQLKSEADIPEFRKVVAKTGNFLRLSSPLLYSHSHGSDVDNYESTANTFFHHIVETVDLSSLTWQVRIDSSDELNTNNFTRRYVGGKVGSRCCACALMSVSAH